MKKALFVGLIGLVFFGYTILATAASCCKCGDCEDGEFPKCDGYQKECPSIPTPPPAPPPPPPAR